MEQPNKIELIYVKIKIEINEDFKKTCIMQNLFHSLSHVFLRIYGYAFSLILYFKSYFYFYQ